MKKIIPQLITFFVIILVFSFVLLYPKIFPKEKESVLGQQKITLVEDQGEEEVTSVDNREILDEKKKEAQDDKKVGEIQNPISSNKTIETSKESPIPDTCSTADISGYNKIINNSKLVIDSANKYLLNPTCNYPYTTFACTGAYDLCVTSVENWYKADGTCDRLPRSGMCATLNQERYARLQICEENKTACTQNCDDYKASEILRKSLEIKYHESLITENQKNLSNCGL